MCMHANVYIFLKFQRLNHDKNYIILIYELCKQFFFRKSFANLHLCIFNRYCSIYTSVIVLHHGIIAKMCLVRMLMNVTSRSEDYRHEYFQQIF